ncbi:MAG: ribosome-associated translation inhibitor RaiA [Pseudomonadota bacterium]
MHISVAGQHVTLSPELQLYVKDKIVETVGRYFEHATSASVHFTKDGPFVLCDMIVHEGSGGNIVIKTEASSDEIYASFDLALAKSEKRLHKYKSKLKELIS